MHARIANVTEVKETKRRGNKVMLNAVLEFSCLFFATALLYAIYLKLNSIYFKFFRKRKKNEDVER